MVENTPAAVTIRFDGVVMTLDDATVEAQKACTAYRKTAHLRRVATVAVAERYAHFDCLAP